MLRLSALPSFIFCLINLCCTLHRGIINAQLTDTATLVNVHVIFRHGDRAPVTIYPTDPNKESAWPMGLGELTTIGMQQHFALGKSFRQHYGHLLSHRFMPKEMHVRSTDVDRTLMSAQANLAGLYWPINDNQTWTRDLKWWPIPVHTVPNVQDILLTDAECPRIEQINKEIYASNDVKKLNQKYGTFMSMISEKSGMHINISNVWQVFDTLFCEGVHGLKGPEWNTTDNWSTLFILNRYNWKLMFYTEEIRRLKMGLLLKKMVNHIRNSTSGQRLNYGSSVMYYSGHDFDVAGLHALFANTDYNGQQPVYAGAIILELHKTSSNVSAANSTSWFVRLLLHNSTNDPAERFPLKIEGCSALDCPLDEFYALTANLSLTSSERKKQCSIKGGYAYSTFSQIFVFVMVALILGITIGLMGTLVFTYVRRRFRSRRSGDTILINEE